jgi:hypothetical protein
MHLHKLDLYFVHKCLILFEVIQVEYDCLVILLPMYMYDYTVG